ncbi:hypothetical protein TRICI_004701 [Trichomonascus ciferrii]|uniref:NAD-dependent epimerase/dehydratase domain-containing protein n=1 Tax=Trichomonascus ciferrii TaxID=44093 RepID=A0A642V038_9ASCO|nr:hypothetical protein TRICI_004701 [Trichomonascus ciferrii]
MLHHDTHADIATIIMGKVLLTGASGFVAAEVLKQLVERGHEVVATVRTEEKAEWIKQHHPNAKIEIKIVSDIQAEDAFDEVLQDNGIVSVIHTASPFFRAKDDPVKELLNPAVKGTTNVLKAIKKFAPQVKHVVVTSSFAAIIHCYNEPSPEILYTEETWNQVTWDEAVSNLRWSYRGSKTFAEKALWEFIEKEKPNFQATTVNPPSVFGPCLQKVNKPDQLNTSNKIIYDLLHSKAGDTTRPEGGYNLWVDNRDVALAHVLAIEKTDVSAGKRWFMTPGYYHPQDVLDIINENFPELKGKLAVGQKIDHTEREETYEKELSKVDNSKTARETGIIYHNFKDTIVDTVSSLLQLDKQWGTSL